MLAQQPSTAIADETHDDTHQPHLRLDRLEKHYGTFTAVADLSIAVKRGELIALLGPSGCGKTTTLRMIAGLASTTSGRILFDGKEIQTLPAYERDMGLVFQSYALFPHMSVARNVAFGLEMRKVPKAEMEERVKRALELVQLAHLAERRPRELSGGQQQRVALARALVIEPTILLLDEPLSNLDAKLRDQMRIEIREIQQRLGITTVFVTHDQVEALSMCDRIAVMEGGRLAQIGTPQDIYERPASLFVAEFVGRANKLAGRNAGPGKVDVGGLTLDTASEKQFSGEATVLIRPHRIEMLPADSAADGRNAATGTVSRATYIGDILEYSVELENGPSLTVENATGGRRGTFASGERVSLRWSAEDTLVFEAAS